LIKNKKKTKIIKNNDHTNIIHITNICSPACISCPPIVTKHHKNIDTYTHKTIFISLARTLKTKKKLQKKKLAEIEEELDSLELVPNIILNPGFCDSDDGDRLPSPLITRFFPYSNLPPQLPQQEEEYDDDEDDDLDEEDQMTFSRKMSIFFTGNTIKRI
jgi:hypothetical protein